MSKQLIVFISFLITLAISSCVIPQKTSTKRYRNYAFLYNPSLSYLQPDFGLMRTSDTTATLYIKIYRDDLLFKQMLSTEPKQAKVNILYVLSPSMRNSAVLDSASKKLNIKYNKSLNEYLIYFKVKTDTFKTSYLKVSVTDENRKQRNYAFFQIEQSRCSNSFDFFISDTLLKPVYNNYIQTHNKCFIRSDRFRGINLYIRQYSVKSAPAAPPFMQGWHEKDMAKLDTSYLFNPISDTLSINKNAVLVIKSDTACNSGRKITAFDNEYPLPSFSKELMEPLQYLMSTEEYDSLTNRSNIKQGIDEFWLKTNQDKKQVRNVLKVFYHRVWFANIFFSSYKEGWKTDRGMIYVIMGPPAVIHKSETIEKWEYTNARKTKKEVFIFEKEESQTTDNQYILKRDVNYKPIWFEAIKTWRSAKLFTIN